MHILDFIRSSDEWQVKLPMYHRGHLGLYPGTTVYLAPVIREADPTAPAMPEASSPPPFHEILGTPIHPKAWTSVYRITVALYDAPGVFHHVLRSVARHGGSVLQLDSTSTDQELYHNVELMVDFASLEDAIRDSSDQIKGLLLADCQQHIVAQQGEPFSLRVFPVSGLRRMHSELSAVQISGVPDVDKQQVGKSGEIALEGVIQHVLANQLDPRVSWRIEPPFRYLVTSDTEDRLFRVTFFPAKHVALWCAIGHLDKPGAIAAVTDSLRSRNLTLLCALNRVQEHTGLHWFEVVLSKPGWRDVSKNAVRPSPENEVRQVLAADDLMEYDLKVFFDRKSAQDSMRETVPKHPPRVELLTRHVTVDNWLKEKEAELQKLAEDPVVGPLTHTQFPEPSSQSRQRGALASGIRLVRRATGKLQPQVFLSVEITSLNMPRILAVQECCKGLSIAFDVVRRSKDKEIIWAEVVARIRQSTHVIALWSPSDKKEITDKRPSPWCLWELGVANAYDKSFRVLVEEGTNIVGYTLIHGQQFFLGFPRDDPAQFKVQAEQAIRSLVFPKSPADDLEWPIRSP